jgi:peptidoglycan-associated lipoprotein
MKAHPSVHFSIEGQCSEDEGDRAKCLNLGKERAGFMADYYVIDGIDRSRLHTISYGKERPTSRNHLYRRVETWPQ